MGLCAMQEVHLHLLRQLPSVDGLAQAFQTGNGSGNPRPKLLLEAARAVLEQKRRQVLSAATVEELNAIQLHQEAMQADMSTWLRQAEQLHFRRAINATGVILHTNLGRALLSQRAAIMAVSKEG